MKIGLLSILLAVLVISLSNGVRAERYEVAASNYQNKKYDLAYEQFLDLAELGNKDAQYAIGLMYLKGFHVNTDVNMAYAWLALSGSKGDITYRELADNVLETIPQTQRFQAQSAYDSVKSTYGDDIISAKSMPALIDSDGINDEILYGFSPVATFKMAPKYPQSALQAGIFGNVTMRYVVASDGRIKYPELGVATNEVFVKPSFQATKAFVYKPTIVNGRPVPVFGVDNTFIFEVLVGGRLSSDEVEKDVNQERIYQVLVDARAKAETGSSVDRYEYAKVLLALGLHLNSSKFDEFNNDKIKYFTKAAIDGLPDAQFELGKTFMYHDQCGPSIDASYFWLHQAAKNGFSRSQMVLGLERISGICFDKNVEKGIEWLETAAATYDPAKLELAVAIATQLEGEQRDLAKAKQLLDSINIKTFEDKVSFYEAQAIVYSAAGSEEALERSLKKLKKEARKFKLPYEVLAQNIQRRLAGQPVVPLRS